MGLSDFIKGQFIDVIEHVDESNKLLVFKFTRQGDEIKQGANLIVRNGQAAVFIHRGRIADIFLPGNYKLNTGNLPILSSLRAITTLFNSPIKSDLYFVNTTQFIGNKWRTKNPILMRDNDLGMARVTAFGTYSFRVDNVELFMNEVFGARKLDMTYDILEFLESFISESVAEAIAQSGVAILDLAMNYRSLADSVCKYVSNKAGKFGLIISETAIENISLPEEVEKLIDEQSGIGMASKNMDNFMKYQTARAMRDSSKQRGGFGGFGGFGGLSGLGTGFAFSNHIFKTVENSLNNTGDNDDKNIDQLREYKKLLDEGIITEEEFKKAKKQILGL